MDDGGDDGCNDRSIFIKDSDVTEVSTSHLIFQQLRASLRLLWSRVFSLLLSLSVSVWKWLFDKCKSAGQSTLKHTHTHAPVMRHEGLEYWAFSRIFTRLLHFAFTQISLCIYTDVISIYIYPVFIFSQCLLLFCF